MSLSSLSNEASFVLGSALFSGLFSAIIMLGFCIQYPNHCPTSSPDSAVGFWTISSWFLYGLFVLFASSGFVEWWVLLGSRWGPRREVPLDALAIGVGTLQVLPFMLLGQAAVASVRVCQR